MNGRRLSVAECDALWEPWTPAELARRMAHVAAPWYVAAGWALDLFIGAEPRPHDDLEIAVPRIRFDEVVAALPGFEWDVVGDGRVWPYPEQAEHHHQTWLRDPATGHYRVDVFREPHRGDRWVCRREESITLPYAEVIRDPGVDSIPYAIPEVVLLFKAKARRDKDEADFQRVLPMLDASRRSRLADWLSRVHPGHPWIDRL